MVHFHVEAWEVLLWEAMIALNTGICIYLLIKEKQREWNRE